MKSIVKYAAVLTTAVFVSGCWKMVEAPKVKTSHIEVAQDAADLIDLDGAQAAEGWSIVSVADVEKKYSNTAVTGVDLVSNKEITYNFRAGHAQDDCKAMNVNDLWCLVAPKADDARNLICLLQNQGWVCGEMLTNGTSDMLILNYKDAKHYVVMGDTISLPAQE